MQLRMSPGGRMRFSRRKRPELPPSSVTVTIAARSETGRSAVASSSGRRTTCSFRPRNSVESPVPPPSATMRKPGRKVFVEDARFFILAEKQNAVSILQERFQLRGIREALTKNAEVTNAVPTKCHFDVLFACEGHKPITDWRVPVGTSHQIGRAHV